MADNIGSGIHQDEFAREYQPPPPRMAHTAANFPNVDMTQPSQFRAVARHIANIHGAANPEEMQQGREWYPKVHEAVAKGIRGTAMTHHGGAALVAAVSPNMDWERSNIHAFDELKGLRQHHWDVIEHSARATPGGPLHMRTPEASSLLKGMSISRATDSGLIRAHRLIQGEDPEDVLPRRTAPKMHSFASNIHDPEGSPHVTIDARAHDIGINKMYPWEYSGRGIGSAASKPYPSGKPRPRTRYEHFEDAYRTASAAVGEEHHTSTQAITWVTGKRLEREAPTKSGAPRVRGVERRGQPYR